MIIPTSIFFYESNNGTPRTHGISLQQSNPLASRLERATNSLRVGLETMKQAEKPERGGKLKTLKNGVKLVEKETVTHVDTVHVSHLHTPRPSSIETIPP